MGNLLNILPVDMNYLWLFVYSLLGLNLALCIRIEPNQTEITVTAYATFTVTCFDNEPVTWILPMNDTVSTNHSISNNKSENTFMSTLTISNATYLNTGYYICKKQLLKNAHSWANIYIYVSDEDHLLAIEEPYTVLQPNEWGDVVIPCRPTSPDVIVNLVNTEDETEILDLPYDPKIGFTKKSSKVKDSMVVKCSASRNTSLDEYMDEKIFQLTINPSDKAVKPYINASGAYHPVEGSNIVLNCSIILKAGSTVFITWIFPDDRIKEKVIEGDQQEVISDNQNKGLKTNYKVITVLNLTKYDGGDYICQVEDSNLNSEQASYFLNVFDPNYTFLNIEVMAEFKNYTVRAGEASVQWILNITSHPRAAVSCMDPNGKEVNSGLSAYIGKYTLSYDGRLAKFVINRVDINDSGTYTFIAFNEHHKKHDNLTLYVQDEPKIEMKKKQEFYNAGEMYQIPCSMTAYPLPRVTWYTQKCNEYPACDGNPIEVLPGSDYSEIVVQSFVLKSILNYRASNTSLLFCSAKNDFGSKNESIPFFVTDMKEGFDASVSSSEITADDNITLTCGVSKYAYTSNIIWHFHANGTKASIRVENMKGVKIIPYNTTFSYRLDANIPRINKTFSGTYLCGADSLNNETKFQAVSVDVKDVVKPEFLQKNMNESTWKIATGEEVKMECYVYGVPKPTVTWYKNDVPILIRQNDTRLNLRKSNQQFTIKFAAADDDGKYTCVATNKAGNISSSNSLALKGVHDDHDHRIYIILPAVLTVSLVVSVAWLLVRMQKERKLRKKLAEDGLLNFESGAVNCLNPDLGIEDQADLLPYDSRWEFPRDKLKLGKQLGSGAFGVVMKAEADGIIDHDTTTIVAVKMVKRGVDPLYIRALASELKIMIHLGRHLNVVNLLGACTKNINKRELVVIVEYCKYGNLHDFLLKQRSNFINQIDEKTGQLDFSLTDVDKNNRYSSGGAMINGSYTGTTTVESVTVEETVIGSDGYLINKDSEPDWRSNYRGDFSNTIVRPIKTSDLICWSFQIARGMEYLASRKVLHGDLAARNVLLADDNIVKICDFGLAKSMYASENYKRKKNELLPVRWMAVESIRDRVFSIQSDVWSFGITLWELFSLSVTPYPGVEHLETLYTKLEDGYRLEKPAYATKDIHAIMLDCWHARPTMRPTFFELSERLGELLENGLRSHYTNLNEMYLQMNANACNGVDYLSLLNPPLYTAAEEPRYVNIPNIPSRESPDPEDDVELKPMLRTTDNNYINSKPLLFSNPSYMEVNRPKKPAYVSTPK